MSDPLATRYEFTDAGCTVVVTRENDGLWWVQQTMYRHRDRDEAFRYAEEFLRWRVREAEAVEKLNAVQADIEAWLNETQRRNDVLVPATITVEGFDSPDVLDAS